MYITWCHIKEYTLDFCKNTNNDICDMLCCHGNNVNIVYLSDEKIAKIGISGHHYNFFINQYIIEFQS